MKDWIVPEEDRVISPNCRARKKPIRMIVLHTTICPRETPDNYARVARWLANPKASGSTHFVILRDGRIIQGVPISKQAWHAGESEWTLVDGTHVKSCNDYAIGIDLDTVGPVTVRNGKMYDCYGKPFDGYTRMVGNKRYEEYSLEQLNSLASLVRRLCDEYHIAEDDVVGHCDVSPGRKVDPENFPWWLLRDLLTSEIYRRDLLSLYSYSEQRDALQLQA